MTFFAPWQLHVDYSLLLLDVIQLDFYLQFWFLFLLQLDFSCQLVFFLYMLQICLLPLVGGGVVCYTAIFSVVTQRSSPQTATGNRTTFLSLCVWWVAWTRSRFLFIPSHFGYQQKNEIFRLVWKLGYRRIYSVETAKQGHKRCCICDRYSPEKQVCWGVIRFIVLELILLLILFILCHTYLKLFTLNYRTFII